MNLAHEEQVLKQGLLHLDEVLKHLEPLHKPLEPPGGSVLLHELVSAPILAEATSNPQVLQQKVVNQLKLYDNTII